MPSIERVSNLSRDEFAAGFDWTDTPVVIEGGASAFKACSLWSPEYLTNRVGSVVVDYKLSASHCHPNFHAPTLGEMFARERGTLGELIQRITTGPASERARRLFTGDERYLLRRRDGLSQLDPELGVLLDDVLVPPLFDPERLYTVWGWLSGAGVRTWLHYDNNGCHNLNAQLTGTKQCALYPPDALAAVEPFAFGGPNPAYNCSAIDVEAAQLPAALASLDAFEATLVPGDLLFIPCYWLHTFRHLGDFNTNVNFWWKPERPRYSQVAARQALLNAAAALKLDAKPGSTHAELLTQLDRALLAGTG